MIDITVLMYSLSKNKIQRFYTVSGHDDFIGNISLTQGPKR